MSSERAQALADQFVAANNEMIATVEGCSESQWQAKCVDEDRPVAVVAHHVAGAYRAVSGWMRTIIAGEPFPPTLTHEFIDRTNAAHAAKHPNPTKEEVLALLRGTGQTTADFIRGMSDADLDRLGEAPLFGDHPLATRSVIKHVLLRHISDHLASIKSTLGQ